MKKINTLLLGLMSLSSVLAQEQQIFPINKTLETPTTLQNYVPAQATNVYNKTISSQWVNYVDAYSNYYGSGPQLSTNYLFPDSTILVNYGQAGYLGAWIHSIAQTFDMNAPVYANAGITITGDYAIELDSIEVKGTYERPDNSVVDTLEVLVVPAGANLNDQYYFAGSSINANLNSDTVFFRKLYYDSINHIVRDYVSSYKVPLDDAFFNTAVNGVHTVKINANDVIPDTSQGIFAIVVNFIPGYTWTPNVDTLGTQKNVWRFHSYELNGSNQYPTYSKQDLNVSHLVPDAVRYNQLVGSWNGSYIPSYAYMGSNPGFSYESMAISVKLTQHAPVVLADCSEPFFSEYVEGTSNNKALEIYNPTGSAIDLSNYQIRKYGNGSSTPTTLTLSGTVASNDVFVIANPNATFANDMTNGIISFNGDDAVELYNIQTSTVVDVIGEVGNDPGSSWPVGTGSTANHTLVRKAIIKIGTDVWTGVVDQQWDVYPQDDFTHLGSHTNIGCFTPLTAVPTINDDTICVQESIQFSHTSTGGATPYTYAWDFGDGNTSTSASGSYTYGTAGTFSISLTVTDASGNIDDSTIVLVVADKPNADFTYSGGMTVSFTDASTVSTGTIVSWDWSFGDASTNATTQNPTHTYTQAGNYSVQLTVVSSVSQSCSSSTTKMVTVSSSPTGVDENSQQEVSIYPNPSTAGIINIKSDVKIQRVEFYNALGQKVYSAKGSKSIDISNLAKGIYTVNFISDKPTSTQQLIVK